ncbi:tryptophan 2,3-dioxygenase [Paremcibacter congregatus]|uniref:Tryptophan 2,3-dioxygenase n=1 Tax=Paremcibacter congregatus TaxID=2043170 RepID=A0A2G4YMU6_9PROT|nr:tryptophan 2,3-dioxygenase [Paremcibacter congregatus]PHZ83625.1 tryptophan 2,3-dioxygenase [Paremcibacter congregatus]QDE27325.1 tryptophan 2,3-dioxygenase [Paremcibacter congregatus]
MTGEKIDSSVDLTGEKIHWSQDVSYGQYLELDSILSAQTLRSDKHDEMMFIIIHQASELWMKLSIHEMTAAMECLKEDNLDLAMKMVARIARIQEQLTQSWNVLSTMTPKDYLSFRDALGQSSGFQSYQYRMIEFSLGNKNKGMIEAHKDHPNIYAQVKNVLENPSIYDLTLQLLARRGFDLPAECLERDWSEPYQAHPDVEAAWKKVYENGEEYWDLYDWAEKLVDLEHRFQTWRFAHMKTVERIIGFRRGTGGTGGVSYLVKALDLRFFPELWTVRTSL